jgi:hypothetical protein
LHEKLSFLSSEEKVTSASVLPSAERGRDSWAPISGKQRRTEGASNFLQDKPLFLISHKGREEAKAGRTLDYTQTTASTDYRLWEIPPKGILLKLGLIVSLPPSH